VAERLDVEVSSLRNWEASRTKSTLEFMPAIIRFLGYSPPPATSWAERLVSGRRVLGISQKESTNRIGVDPCTLVRWERGEREPWGEFVVRAERLLATGDREDRLMRFFDHDACTERTRPQGRRLRRFAESQFPRRTPFDATPFTRVMPAAAVQCGAATYRATVRCYSM
jgi:transcriptional regulator with XRE-family HTH domain